MKVTKIEAYPIHLKYKPGFELVVHYGTIDAMNNYLLKVHTDDGLFGWGEVAPLPINNPDAFDQAPGILEQAAKLVIGCDPFDIRGIHKKMEAIPDDLTVTMPTKGGIDFALYDLMGKAANQPIYKLLGGKYTGPLAMHYTLSIRSPEEMAKEARERVDQGFRTLEVKVGRYEGKLVFDDEVARIRAIREAVGPDVCLCVDPNLGWDNAEAIEILGRMEPFDIMVEQPVQGKKNLVEVRKAISVPVVADESALNLKHLVQLVRMDACDMINLKILRHGGLYKSMQMMEVCEAFGLSYRHDNVFQTRLASTTCLHFAIAYNRGLPDAGGTQFTRTSEDVVRDGCGLIMRGGAADLTDPEAPGSGAEPKEEYLRDPIVFS